MGRKTRNSERQISVSILSRMISRRQDELKAKENENIDV